LAADPDQQALDDLIERALAEDIGDGDVTVAATIPKTLRFRGVMAARQDMVVAGLDFARQVFARLVADLKWSARSVDGTKVGAGAVLAELEGDAGSLLTAERTALNLMQHLSGVATLTRSYVDRLAGTGATLLDTRKTIPGLRRLEKYATRMGGARNHRMGLYDAVLIKDNHIAVYAAPQGAATGKNSAVMEVVRRARLSTKAEIEVECDTLEQVDEAVAAGADMILLDNMDLATLREAVKMAAGRVPLEASGGVNLETIRGIAETGVDFISVGRITQSSPAVDIGLDVTITV
jgi:nicotinate-nucleotide pyrophosphorylase (carboxylating)